MLWVALAGCSSAASTTPRATVGAPPPPVEPMCSGVECEAKLETEPRFEPPNPEEWRPPDAEVTPPEQATCAMVGEVVASIEVGNYADPEERAPVVAKHAAICDALKLDQATRTCIAEQGDKMSIAYCSPEMVPDTKIEIVAAADCTAAIDAANARLASRPAYDWEKKWWSPRAAAFLASCKKDRWTKQLGDCVKNGQAQYCSQYQGVRPLQVKLDAMLQETNKKEQERQQLWAQAYLEPKKYPHVKVELVKPRACAEIIKAANARIEKQGGQSWEKTWWTPRAKAYATSCRKDRWTIEVGDCVKMQYAANCYQYAPPALQQKLFKLHQQALPGAPTKPPKKPTKPKNRRAPR